jgi:oligosaccharide 4-alpha-D-glucosyltransferase
MVNQMLAEGFPLDAIVFDLQWQGGVEEMGNLAWDLSRFPDPQGMLQDFLMLGVKSVCIADPYFTQNCQHFDFLANQGWFAEEQDGSPYILYDFWAGPSGLIDITDTTAADWLWQRCKHLLDNGVTGLWTDLGEPERAPADMFFEAGNSQAVRQTYNLRWSGGICDRFTNDYPNNRLFNLTRSGYAGMQRFSTFPWSGDVQKSFEGMSAQIPIMLGMGLCGCGYMHSDIGGFTGAMNPELYTRWQQMGAFSPVMRAHGVGVPTEPIYYPEPYKSIVKEYIQLRYQLLPYNYTVAYINSITGMPLARPLFFEDPSLPDVDDEYLWGNDFLVAPVLEEGAVERNVVFPPGMWIGFFDWVAHEGGMSHLVTAPLEVMPLFVNAGAIIPMLEDIQFTGQYTGDNYLIKYFADPQVSQSQARIYLDDGTSRLAVTQGEFSIIHLLADYSRGDVTIDFTREGDGYNAEPLQKEMVFEIPRTSATPTSVYYNFVQLPITDNQEVYEALDNVVLFDPRVLPLRLYVKIQWNSSSFGKLEINGLEVATDISIAENSIPKVHVFPNPVTGESRINFAVEKPGRYQLTLQNSLGKQISGASIIIDFPMKYSLRFQELFPGKVSSGIYILSISDQDNKASTIKIIAID